MLTTGNTKLGSDIASWSLPAITTCPGATDACRTACYAGTGHYSRSNVKDALALRLRESRKRRFVENILASLEKTRQRVVRVHASGDFYSPEYASAWVDIASEARDRIFFAYTRSWREPAILEPLTMLAGLPNVRLWFSCDRETGRPPRLAGVRRAYMACDDDDRPKFPVDLVFRVSRKTVVKFYPDGRLVCPAENGVTDMTCTACGLCWRRDRIPRKPPSGAKTVEGRRA